MYLFFVIGYNRPIMIEATKMKNPVAKHARSFNKAATFKDRKKALKKGDYKHKKCLLIF